MSVVWFLAARTVERGPAVRQAQQSNLQNLPVEADRRSGEEFLECVEFDFQHRDYGGHRETQSIRLCEFRASVLKLNPEFWS